MIPAMYDLLQDGCRSRSCGRCGSRTCCTARRCRSRSAISSRGSIGSELALFTVDRDLCDSWPELEIVPLVGDEERIGGRVVCRRRISVVRLWRMGSGGGQGRRSGWRSWWSRLGHRFPTRYVAVRCGNVLGSAGSVIPRASRRSPRRRCSRCRRGRSAEELSSEEDVSLLKATSEPLVHTRDDRHLSLPTPLAVTGRFSESDLRCPFSGVGFQLRLHRPRFARQLIRLVSP